MKHLDIYGELHTNEERDRIEALIKIRHKEIKYDFILSEEAGDFVYYTNRELQKAIDGFVTSIGVRSFELGIRLGLPVIGIDKWSFKNTLKLKLSEKFRQREARMHEVITEYSKKGNVAVIIGDTHLRTTKSDLLGDKSILSDLSAGTGVMVLRSPLMEIE